MKKLFVLIVLLALASCTSYNRKISIYVEDGGTLTMGDIEVLAEWTKGDEKLTNTPDISPTLSVPITP